MAVLSMEMQSMDETKLKGSCDHSAHGQEILNRDRQEKHPICLQAAHCPVQVDPRSPFQ